MSLASTALAIVQLVAVGKELVALFEEGKISEEDMLARWRKNASELDEIERSWRERHPIDNSGYGIGEPGSK